MPAIFLSYQPIKTKRTLFYFIHYNHFWMQCHTFQLITYSVVPRVAIPVPLAAQLDIISFQWFPKTPWGNKWRWKKYSGSGDHLHLWAEGWDSIVRRSLMKLLVRWNSTCYDLHFNYWRRCNLVVLKGRFWKSKFDFIFRVHYVYPPQTVSNAMKHPRHNKWRHRDFLVKSRLLQFRIMGSDPDLVFTCLFVFYHSGEIKLNILTIPYKCSIGHALFPT